METSYDVRIWAIEKREYTSKTTYRVSWRVGKDTKPHKESFATQTLANSFRSELVAAASRGEAFRLVDGLPVSKSRATKESSWFEFACKYIDFKWDDSAPGHRRNIVEALASATPAMLATNRGKPTNALLRAATITALNRNTRNEEHSDKITQVIRWLERNTRQIGDLRNAEILHGVLKAISQKVDGTKAQPGTLRRKRVTINNAFEYAVACELLDVNPLKSEKAATVLKQTRKARLIKQVDKRQVANPVQARTLLNAVGETGSAGRRLKAFFGCMYYAALRPEEAAWLNKSNLSIPDKGWGRLHLEFAVPDVAETWTNSRSRTEARELKHRAPGEGRTVPCPPELTELLHWHIEEFGTAPDGRLFRGVRNNGRVASSVYSLVWSQAREAAFTPEVFASPLAKRPYDLRHAALTTWLTAGVQPKKVAEWAGHSLRVLLEVYAAVLDGSDAASEEQIDSVLQPKRKDG